MKKILLSLTVFCLVSGVSFANDAVFTSLDPVEPVSKVNLQPTGTNVSVPVPTSVQKLPSTFQEEQYKKAITNLEDASVGIREQLVNYNSQLSAAQSRLEQAKSEVKELKSYVRTTKKRMKNIEKSKKLINANFEAQNAAN